MKILEVFGEPISNGGQEAFVINVINTIDMSELQIDCLTPYYCENDFYKSVVESRGGQVFAFNLPFTPGKSRKNIYKVLLEFLKKNSYDAIHIHSGSISVLKYASQAAKKAKIEKILVHSHCAADKKTLKYRIVKVLSFSAISKCPTHYCACSQVAGFWKFPKKIASKKLIEIRNGVDIEKFRYNRRKDADIRKKYGIPENAFVVGHVGRFSYQKNHEFLIKIFSALKNRIEKSYLLLLGSGELLEDVVKQTKELCLDDRVIFVGNVNNAEDYYQAMNVFVLPSRFEGLPIVGVEAQASGLPVITSKNVSDELNIGKNVVFLDLSEDVEPWVDEICHFIDTPRSDNTQRLIDKGYSIADTAGMIRKIYLGTY